MSFSAVILAAGQGTRMRSPLAKVLHTIDGRPLLTHVLDAAHSAGADHLLVVVGHQRDTVSACAYQWALRHHAYDDDVDLDCVVQEPQRGTGHAVQQCLPHLPDQGAHTVAVLCGDVPLLSSALLQRMRAQHVARQSDITVLTAHLDDPTGYGRVFFHPGVAQRTVASIREHKDCTDEERACTTVNAGIYLFRANVLHAYLPKLRDNNRAGELYLTDVVRLASDDGRLVHDVHISDRDEVASVEGVNTPEQLQRAAEAWARQPR